MSGMDSFNVTALLPSDGIGNDPWRMKVTRRRVLRGCQFTAYFFDGEDSSVDADQKESKALPSSFPKSLLLCSAEIVFVSGPGREQ